MARRKTFSTYQTTPLEPVEIDINGTIFKCAESMPGQVLLDFIAESNADDPASMVTALTNIMKEAIVPEQWDEWNTFIRDPANNVSLETLSEIAGYVAEEYTGRPL